MFDTHAIARSLTDAGFNPAQADAITAAVRDAHSATDYVTRADLRADLLALELRLIKWIVGTAIGIVGAMIAIVRMLG